MKGKTESGFEFNIDESNLDDMNFVDALSDLVSGDDITAISRVANYLFGKDQKKRLYKHLAGRDEKGKVRLEAFTKEIVDILNSQADTKNY